MNFINITDNNIYLPSGYQEALPASSDSTSSESTQLYTLITTDGKRIYSPGTEFEFWVYYYRFLFLCPCLSSSQNCEIEIPLSFHAFHVLESYLKDSASPQTLPLSQNNLKNQLIIRSQAISDHEPIVNLISLMAEIDSFAEEYSLFELRHFLTSVLKESEILNLFNANSIEQLLQFVYECNPSDKKYIYKFTWLGLISFFKNDFVLNNHLDEFAIKLNIKNISIRNELSTWFRETFSADFALTFLQTILHNKETAFFDKKFDFALSLIRDYFPNYFDQSSYSPYPQFFTYMVMTIADHVQTTEQAHKFFQLFKDLSPRNKNTTIQFSRKELQTMKSKGFIPVVHSLNQPQSVLLTLAYQRIIKNLMNKTPHDSLTIKNVSIECFISLCLFEERKEDHIWQTILKVLELEFPDKPTNGLDLIPLSIEIKFNSNFHYALSLLKKNFPDYFNPSDPSPNEQIFTYMLTSIADRVETVEQAKKLFRFFKALHSTAISPSLQSDLILITLRQMMYRFVKEKPCDISKITGVIVLCFGYLELIGADNEKAIWRKIGRVTRVQFPNTNKGQLENTQFLIKIRSSLEAYCDLSQNSINKIFALHKKTRDWKEEDVNNIIALAQHQLPSHLFRNILRGAVKSNISLESKIRIAEAFPDTKLKSLLLKYTEINLLHNSRFTKTAGMRKIINLWTNKDFVTAKNLIKEELSFLTIDVHLKSFVSLFCKERGVANAFVFFHSLKDIFKTKIWQDSIFDYLNTEPIDSNQIIQFLTLLKVNNQPFYTECLFKFLKLVIENNAGELKGKILARIIEHLSNNNFLIKDKYIPWSAMLMLKNPELKQLEELTYLLMTKAFDKQDLQFNYPYFCAINLLLNRPLEDFSGRYIKDKLTVLIKILQLQLPNEVFLKVLEISMELYKNGSRLDQFSMQSFNNLNSLLIDKMFKHGMALAPRERQQLFRSALVLRVPDKKKSLIKLLFMRYFATQNEDPSKKTLKSLLGNFFSKRDVIFHQNEETSELTEKINGLIKTWPDANRFRFLRKFGKKLAPYGIDELRELRNILPEEVRNVLTLEFLKGNNKKPPVNILNLFSHIRFNRCESIIYSALFDHLPKITIKNNVKLINEDNDVQMTEGRGSKREREKEVDQSVKKTKLKTKYSDPRQKGKEKIREEDKEDS